MTHVRNWPRGLWVLLGLTIVLSTMLLPSVVGQDAPLPVESARLTAPDGRELDMFGQAVDASGDAVAVGAPRASKGGAVYVFPDAAGSGPVKKLASPTPGWGEQFGIHVALDGEWLVALENDRDAPTAVGSLQVFHHDGGTWTHHSTLVPEDPSRTALRGHVYLEGLAMDSGSIAVLGVRQGTGWVVFEFQLDGGTWTQVSETPIGYAGILDLHGDRFAVANYRDVRVFERDGVGGWTQVGHKIGPTPSVPPGSGAVSLSVHGDRVAVGYLCPPHDSRQRVGAGLVLVECEASSIGTEGVVAVWRSDPSGAWVEEDSISQPIDGPTGTSLSKNGFGREVELGDGLLLVGSPGFAAIGGGSTPGEVNVFLASPMTVSAPEQSVARRVQVGWEHAGRLVSVPASGALWPSFGYSLALDGPTAVVGEPAGFGGLGSSAQPGAAHVYTDARSPGSLHPLTIPP